MNEIHLRGKINDKGEYELQAIERYKAFAKAHKGKPFILTIRALDPRGVDKYVWYIMKNIVPEIIRGHKEHGEIVTPQWVTDWIESTPPFARVDDKQHYTLFDWRKYQPACDMNPIEIEFAVEWLLCYCVDNFNIVIP